MPALPAVPSVLKCSIQHLFGGVPVYVHEYLRYSGSPPAQADASAIANSIKSAWSSNLAALCHPSVVYQTTVVTDLNSATGGQGQSNGTVAGTLSGFAMTSNDAFLVNRHIQRRYRGGKPRQYWPFGVIASVNDPQHWTSTFITTVTAAYNAWITALSAITWGSTSISGPVNVSYYQGFTSVQNPSTGRWHNVPKLRATPVVDVITSSSMNSRIATQRRREHFSA